LPAELFLRALAASASDSPWSEESSHDEQAEPENGVLFLFLNPVPLGLPLLSPSAGPASSSTCMENQSLTQRCAPAGSTTQLHQASL
jgi:hypothetical protein